MQSFSANKRFTRLPLAVEITLILVVKIALLTLLWKAFFSEPQTKKMRMPTNLVEQHFLSQPPAAPASSTPSHPSPSETRQ
ncbi:cytochrome oxidase putative small subunit CydP [Collimonas sp. H4R21]|jgi:hypothetical protein|uniref:Cytochrome oxidase putative small subunit CydP n=1 Tax=Collimonas rhizosphaerae TaxID=3126357 RepID=A0ABU9Q1Y1_9BURK|nr:cytochrome oxidase putative small subunit CydP [Collimonas sp. OK412]SFB85656.1 hypothetical protein SAMN04515619_102255 [Collimonas sp. OK412]